MSIRAKENQLFREWAKKRKPFVRDGVVSEEYYRKLKPKIVFIMKEVNKNKKKGAWDLGKSGRDLREYLRDDARGRRQTWDNIARWVHGIREIWKSREMPTWEFYEDENMGKIRKETLKSICAMNLKKTPGGHTANQRNVKRVAKKDREYIREQYEIYDPDLTICCGAEMGDLFKDVAGYNAPEDWDQTDRGIWWFTRGNTKKYVVDFAHPEARIQDPILLYSLLDAVKEIRQTK